MRYVADNGKIYSSIEDAQKADLDFAAAEAKKAEEAKKAAEAKEQEEAEYKALMKKLQDVLAEFKEHFKKYPQKSSLDDLFNWFF